MAEKIKYTKYEIEKYYNEFNEDNRLLTRHGNVEFVTSLKYIHDYLNDKSQKIIDIGAGTGRYSVALADEGYDVTAVELVKHNVEVIKAKKSRANVYQGNAMDLSQFEDESFDVALLFGPMYHLFSKEDKLKALNEAKRVTKKNGVLLVAYYMNEYGIITYGFKKHNIKQCMNQNRLTDDYHMIPGQADLYDMVRIEDINELNELACLTRIKIVASDGAANYLRPFLNDMSEDEYNEFINYHLKTCERMDLIGASGHTLDILKK